MADSPDSERRRHRLWFENPALADLLDADFGLASKDNLCRCRVRLLLEQTVTLGQGSPKT